MRVKTVVKHAARAIGNAFSGDTEAESTDVLDTLKKEHDEVKELLENLSDAEASAQRRSLDPALGPREKSTVSHGHLGRRCQRRR